MDSHQKYKMLKIKWFYFGIVLTLGRVYYATIQNYYTSFMKIHTYYATLSPPTRSAYSYRPFKFCNRWVLLQMVCAE